MEIWFTFSHIYASLVILTWWVEPLKFELLICLLQRVLSEIWKFFLCIWNSAIICLLFFCLSSIFLINLKQFCKSCQSHGTFQATKIICNALHTSKNCALLSCYNLDNLGRAAKAVGKYLTRSQNCSLRPLLRKLWNQNNFQRYVLQFLNCIIKG